MQFRKQKAENSSSSSSNSKNKQQEGIKTLKLKHLLIWVKIFKIEPRKWYFKFFKGWLPQILLGPFLNTLTHM